MKTGYEETYFKSLISEFYLMGTDPLIVEEIIKEAYPLNDNKTLKELIDYLNMVYLKETEPNSGLKGLSNFIEASSNKKKAVTIIKKLEKILNKYNEKKTLTYEVGTDKYIMLDQQNDTIIKQSVNFKNKMDMSTYETIINAYPTSITIYDSKIDGESRTFSIKWSTNNSKGYFKTNNMTIKEIEDSLEEQGYVISPRLLRGTLAAVIQMSINHGIAVIKSNIETPGFYLNGKKEKMVIVNYEQAKPSFDELKEALIVLDKLEPFFKNHTEKLATGLKWGLLSPFAYMQKQMGLPLEKLVPYLYLYGKAGSGKTTLGRIILYLWDSPNNENDMGGSEFDTVARIGRQLNKSTFPILINEPQSTFNKTETVEILKTAVERTTCRGRFEGRFFRNIPALSPVMFASNYPLPSDDSLQRRHEIIMFSHNERKTKDEKNSFDETFNFSLNDMCSLHRLKFISQFFVNEINEDINLLKLNWKELANTMLIRLYADLEMEVPKWLMGWCESTTVEDMDNEEMEDIRIFLIEEINKKMQKITVVDEDGYYKNNNETFSLNIKTGNEFTNRVRNVINERLIPWLILHKGRDNKEYVCFTVGIKKDLHHYSSTCYDLKSISELLKWEYKLVKLPKPTKVMVVRFDKFLSFIYPDLTENKKLIHVNNENKEGEML